MITLLPGKSLIRIHKCVTLIQLSHGCQKRMEKESALIGLEDSKKLIRQLRQSPTIISQNSIEKLFRC